MALGGGNDFDVTERGYDSDWDDLDVGTGDDADIVDLLSDSGAALQHDENGMLPLHYAVAYGATTGVLDVLFEKDFLKNVKKKGEYFHKKLHQIMNKYPKIIKEIRGTGLIIGLKMAVDNIEFMKKLLDHKMLTIKAEENVVRIFPPLTVNNDELDEAISIIEAVCNEMN